MAPGDDDLSMVTSRLRSSLEGVRGKLRVTDVWTLAGFAGPSNARAKLVAHAMRSLGWDRGRLRFDGALRYAYVRGSQLEREVVLDVQRGEDGQLIVKQREP